MDKQPESLGRSRILAAGMAITFLLIALPFLSDFGPTWDCAGGDYAYGERILEYLLTEEPLHLESEYKSPYASDAHHPNFQLRFHWDQLFPLASTLSAASCLLFHSKLGIVSALSAHHLVILLFVAFLIYSLVRFSYCRIGLLGAVATVLFLICSPRFFAHTFNNLKDIPEACLYSFAVLAGYKAVTEQRKLYWIITGVFTGMALAQKTNALFIPIQLGLFAVILWCSTRKKSRETTRFSFFGLSASVCAFVTAYFLFSPIFWSDTFSRLKLHFGEISKAGNALARNVNLIDNVTITSNVSWDGVNEFIGATPVAMLVLALVACFSSLLDTKLRIFLALWVFIPVSRTALPGMRNFDGVRHFIEFYPALAMLAACGLVTITRFVRDTSEHIKIGRLSKHILLALITLCAIGPGFLATVTTYPNGVCYYNLLYGSFKHQQEIGNPNASDYWGNSYWQGLDWINRTAEIDAGVIVPIAPHVVECAAPIKMRGDLRFLKSPPEEVPRQLIVMYITRAGWYSPLIKDLDDQHASYEISVQDGVILRIYILDNAVEIEQIINTWKRDKRAEQACKLMMAWIQKDKDACFAKMAGILDGLTPETLPSKKIRLLEILPKKLHKVGSDALWYITFKKTLLARHLDQRLTN